MTQRWNTVLAVTLLIVLGTGTGFAVNQLGATSADVVGVSSVQETETPTTSTPETGTPTETPAETPTPTPTEVGEEDDPSEEEPNGAHQATRVTVRDVSVDRIVLESVVLNNFTFQLPAMGTAQTELSERQVENELNQRLSEVMSMVNVGEVIVEGVQVSRVTIENGTVTVDATIDRIVLLNVSAEELTVRKNFLQMDAGEMEGDETMMTMFGNDALSIGSVTVEGLHVGEITVESASTQTATEDEAVMEGESPTETETETGPSTETMTPAETVTPTETATETHTACN